MTSATAPTLSIEDNDQEISFRYCPIDQSNTAIVSFRFESYDERLRLDGAQDRIWLQKVVGGSYTLIADGGTGNHLTEQGVWYTITIRAAGSYVGVWRQQDGGPKELILEGNDAPTYDNNRFLIEIEQDAQYEFDDFDIKINNNLNDFLHLDEDSPAIDATLPPVPGVYHRDFDDQFGPVAGDPLTPTIIISDMGADEYPTDPGFTYWWRNF
jgi:hypothetical protein